MAILTRTQWLLPALHIHISKACKVYLDRLGGYHIKERGEITIKVSAQFAGFSSLFPFLKGTGHLGVGEETITDFDFYFLFFWS